MALEGNLTLQILHKAEREGYGILSQTWYISSPRRMCESSLTYSELRCEHGDWPCLRCGTRTEPSYPAAVPSDTRIRQGPVSEVLPRCVRIYMMSPQLFGPGKEQ